MKITETKIFPLNNGGNLQAFASVTFDNEFVVTGIRLLEGKNGYFISMPQKKDSNNEYHDICFPITKKLRDLILDAVIGEFEADDEKPKKRGRR